MYDVCIVGAGVAGLYTLKHCLEQGLRTERRAPATHAPRTRPAIAVDRAPHLGGV
jgi:glycine/D-amino acid oxidase-like deaminating enzyme